MKTKRPTSAQRRRLEWLPQGVGLAPELYAAAVRHLFDRPVPGNSAQDWYWDVDAPEFEATPLEWTRIQTVLFANAGTDLAGYSDEQVGLGLNYVMSSGISDVPLAATHASVPLDEAMRMMQAMPALWRDCIGPRLAHVHAPVGASPGRLGYVCYMWFDVWPTFWNAQHEPRWQEAVWHVLRDMLDVPCREVQIAALHGIGHEATQLNRAAEIDRAVTTFIRLIDSNDQNLRNYAEAARQGMVQ